VIRNLHVERRRALRNGFADAAQADDAQARAADLGGEGEGALLPFAAAGKAVGPHHVARHGQHQAMAMSATSSVSTSGYG
jgi:hypothetical protein